MLRNCAIVRVQFLPAPNSGVVHSGHRSAPSANNALLIVIVARSPLLLVFDIPFALYCFLRSLLAVTLIFSKLHPTPLCYPRRSIHLGMRVPILFLLIIRRAVFTVTFIIAFLLIRLVTSSVLLLCCITLSTISLLGFFSAIFIEFRFGFLLILLIQFVVLVFVIVVLLG